MRLRPPWRSGADHDDALFLEPLDEPVSRVRATWEPDLQPADSWRPPEGEQPRTGLRARRFALISAVAALAIVAVLIVLLAGALRATRTLTTTVASPATTSRVAVPRAHAAPRNRARRRTVKTARRAPKPPAAAHRPPGPSLQARPRVTTPPAETQRPSAHVAGGAPRPAAREFSPAQAEFSFEDGAGR